MRKLLVAALFLVSGFINAQQKTPTAVFDAESHDFGKIKEADGLASFQFSFRNMGAAPLILKSVQASCGCTTPSYSKEPVLPGAKGFIDVTYNPQNRPGHFEKSITVTTNGDPETIVLKIEGEVIPKPASTNSPEDYQIDIDGLKLKSNQITFSPIYFGQSQTQRVDILNMNEKPVAVDFVDVPKHIRMTCIPKILKPHEKGIVEVVYDSKIKNDWDFVVDRIGITLNGKSNPSKNISVVAIIMEDFSKLSDEQKKNAPKVEFANSVFEFGTIKPGEKVSHDFIFKNTGKSDLIIHKTTTTCGCTVAEPKLKVIKPGESSSITLTFNSAGQRVGTVNKGIKIVSNDPMGPVTNLMIKGTIETPKQDTQNQKKE